MLDKAYDPQAVEDAIYKRWEESGAFKPESCDPKGEPFTVSMPPPNATGQLHLGHAVMLALEDIFVRFARMQGKKALWVPGTDHAAIATENVVIKMLKDGGMKDPRKELGREKLVAKIAEFVEKSKNTIRGQVRKMGSSCDWSRERYTFEPSLNRCVNEVFCKMKNDGLIYRGHRIVNWDPKLQTTVSDDEIEYKEEKGVFYTFKYGPFDIGTSRPETKFGDKYVVMHPKDKRYSKYKHGETFEAEWINGPVRATVIKDECVDMEFGTGVMTITPWHDKIDFDIAERHGLEKEQIIGFDGKLLEVAGEFAGMSIEKARPLIAEKLASKGLLVKTDENYVHNKAVSQRGGGAIEPQIKLQWFVDVNKEVVDWKSKGAKKVEKMSLKQIMHSVVHHGDIEIIPDRFSKTYFHWIDNLRDWCISRQIWWGHRVPVWYKGTETYCGAQPLEGVQKIILARHGESEGNKKNIAQGQNDPLTEKGVEHARRLLENLQGRPIKKIISSPSVRAKKTADIVAKGFGLSVEVWDDLRGYDFGSITGTPEIEGQMNIERALAAKTGETLEHFYDRTKRAFEKLQCERSNGEILVVSHRTNFTVFDVVRDGGTPADILRAREKTESAGYGLWGEITTGDWEQDPDTLDTWFSSAMWTWSTFVDPQKALDPKLSLEEILKASPDFQTFHPTSVMETGYDILFFWVARMILMTTYTTGQIPFKTVYLHGLIRTRDGAKMSKSHPETMIDPLDMISKYGADALRLSMIVGQSPGADSRLYEEKIAGYRNFINKLWNASRFVLMQCEKSVHASQKDPKKIVFNSSIPLSPADEFILAELQNVIEDTTRGLEKYKLSEVGQRLYSFIWDDLCDWYLEFNKVYRNDTAVLIHVLRNVLQLLHPFCPFVTEELWKSFAHEHDSKMLISKAWPSVDKDLKIRLENRNAIFNFRLLIEAITGIRKIRAENNIDHSQKISAYFIAKGRAGDLLKIEQTNIKNLAGLENLIFKEKLDEKNVASFFGKDIEIHVPLTGLIDPAKLKASLEKEKGELTKYVQVLGGKLQNKNFVDRAPKDLVDAEKAKLSEAEEKLRKIAERLSYLGL